jgi:hypothetical protein
MLETEASRERWAVRLSLIAGVVALCAAIFTGWQAWEAHQTRKDTQAQFERAQQRADRDAEQARKDSQQALEQQTKLADRSAEQAKRSADSASQLVRTASDLVAAARDQAARAKDNVEAIQDQIRLDQRAWVTVDVGEKTGTFAVAMRNTGRTPAINATAVTAFSGGNRMGPPDVDLSRNSSSAIAVPPNAPKEFLERLRKEGYVRDKPPTGYVIAPGATQVSSDYQGKFTQIFSIGGDRAYIQGRVTYDDVFGKAHETTFCYWFVPPSDFVMCNDHNKMN